MFGKRGLFGKKDSGPPRKENTFEPEGSPKRIRNPVPRGSGDVPFDDIIRSIERTRREHGLDALTNVERFIYEAHIFESYFFHQGGFDYYFAHIDDQVRWADAATALMIMGRDDLTPVFRQAVELFVRSGSNDDSTVMKDYLEQIDSLDRQFRESIPDYEARLRTMVEKHYPFGED